MTDFIALLSGSWRFLAFLSMQGVIITWLLRRLTRHSLALWIQRDEVDGRVRLRLAVQNNEGVPLRGPAELRVRLDNTNARFIADPVVFAGCKTLGTRSTGKDNEWRLSFDEIPPYDSWTIECYVSAHVDVTFTLSDGDSRPSHSRVRLVGTESSTLVGTDVSPDPLLAALVILASEAAYFLWALLDFRAQTLNWTDGFVGIGLALFGIVAFFLIARKPHPVMQGYWKPSAVTLENAPRDVGEPARTHP